MITTCPCLCLCLTLVSNFITCRTVTRSFKCLTQHQIQSQSRHCILTTDTNTLSTSYLDEYTGMMSPKQFSMVSHNRKLTAGSKNMIGCWTNRVVKCLSILGTSISHQSLSIIAKQNSMTRLKLQKLTLLLKRTIDLNLLLRIQILRSKRF